EFLQGKFAKPVPAQNELKSPPAGISAKACWMPASAACIAEVPPFRLLVDLRLRLLKKSPAPVTHRRSASTIITTTREKPHRFRKIAFINNPTPPYDGSP